MSFQEFSQVKGKVRVLLRDARTGEILEERTSNIATKPGVFHILDNLYDRTNVLTMDTTNGYCAVGEGSIAANAWLSGLQTEVSGTGNPGRETINDISRTNQTTLYSTYFDTTEASGALTECGLFATGYDSGGVLLTASATIDSGVMYAYATFPAITKSSSSTLTAEWEVSL